MTAAALAVGQQVRISAPLEPRYDGRLARVTKVNKVNVKVELDGGGLLVVHPSFLSTNLDAPPVSAPRAVPLEPLPPPVGTIVEYVGDPDPRMQGPHVVIGDATSRGRLVVRIAKLGGDNGHYWRADPRALRVVEHFNLEPLD